MNGNETLHVRRIPTVDDAHLLSDAMQAAGVPWHHISCQPWAAYPYKPDVRFRIAHTGWHILLHYHVEEEAVAALAADNGRVWEDSCCEFFLQPEGEGMYYNIECNCAGSLLIGSGLGRNNRTLATQKTLHEVQRWSSLGAGQFHLRQQTEPWQLSLIVPTTALFSHSISSLSGLRARGNFYKCGDLLPRPHFLSWHNIQLSTPNFHCPDFFSPILFE